MQCPRCQWVNRPNSQFCSQCRTALPAYQIAAQSPRQPSYGWLRENWSFLFLACFGIFALIAWYGDKPRIAAAPPPVAIADFNEVKAQVHWLKQDNEALRARVNTLEESLKNATDQIEAITTTASYLSDRVDDLESDSAAVRTATGTRSTTDMPATAPARPETVYVRPSPTPYSYTNVPTAPYSTSYPPPSPSVPSYTDSPESARRVPSTAGHGTYTGGYSGSAKVRVKGYVRRDGTHVSSHVRTKANNTEYDNWSTQGNINPYTGARGTKTPKR